MIARNGGIETLFERIQGKKLACCGAGKYLAETCRAFESFGFFERIDYILDNDPAKQGRYFEFGGEKKLISSPEDCFSKEKDIVIVLTTMYFYEFFEALNDDPRLEGSECYLFALLESPPPECELPPQGEGQLKIPKKIHYVWAGGNPLPDNYKSYVETWRKQCPDYEIIEWNEQNYDFMKHPYMREAYKAGKWGFASDYARLDIVYEHGGIYLDTDVELVRSLDDLLYEEAFCGMQSRGIINTGNGFGAVKGFPLIKEMRDAYDTASFTNSDGSLILTPCTEFQTSVAKKYGFRNENIVQTVNGMVVFPTDVLSPKNLYTGVLARTKHTYAIHHFDATWTDKSFKKNLAKFKLATAEFIKLAGKKWNDDESDFDGGGPRNAN